MTGIMAAMLGIGGGNLTGLTVTVGTANSSNGATTQTFWGWSVVGFLNGQPNSTYYPNSSSLNVGSVSPVSPTIGGFDIVGVYSIGINNASTATYYAVMISGDTSANPNLINNLTVDGTGVAYSTRTVNYVAQSRDSTNIGGSLPSTYYLFTLTTPATTLFGTTAGAVKSVVIS